MRTIKEVKQAEEIKRLRKALEKIQNKSYEANLDEYEHAYEHACDDINNMAKEG